MKFNAREIDIKVRKFSLWNSILEKWDWKDFYLQRLIIGKDNQCWIRLRVYENG